MSVLHACTFLLMSIAQGAQVIDLTHPFGRDTIYWPNADPNFFNLTNIFKGYLAGSSDIWFEINRFNAVEHGGTHMDAPCHFSKGSHTVDQINPQNLQGSGVVVDISEKAARDRNATVTIEDLRSWESKHGRIPSGAIVLMYSGWSVKWTNRTDYLGTSKTGTEALAELQFPGFHPDAASFLVNEREINGVGVDTPSLDPGISTDFPAHRMFFSKKKYGLENVANLERLPASGTIISAFPVLIEGGSGAPCRIIATMFKGSNNSLTLMLGTFLALLLFLLGFLLISRL